MSRRERSLQKDTLDTMDFRREETQPRQSRVDEDIVPPADYKTFSQQKQLKEQHTNQAYLQEELNRQPPSQSPARDSHYAAILEKQFKLDNEYQLYQNNHSNYTQQQMVQQQPYSAQQYPQTYSNNVFQEQKGHTQIQLQHQTSDEPIQVRTSVLTPSQPIASRSRSGSVVKSVPIHSHTVSHNVLPQVVSSNGLTPIQIQQLIKEAVNNKAIEMTRDTNQQLSNFKAQIIESFNKQHEQYSTNLRSLTQQQINDSQGLMNHIKQIQELANRTTALEMKFNNLQSSIEQQATMMKQAKMNSSSQEIVHLNNAFNSMQHNHAKQFKNLHNELQDHKQFTVKAQHQLTSLQNNQENFIKQLNTLQMVHPKESFPAKALSSVQSHQQLPSAKTVQHYPSPQYVPQQPAYQQPSYQSTPQPTFQYSQYVPQPAYEPTKNDDVVRHVRTSEGIPEERQYQEDFYQFKDEV